MADYNKLKETAAQIRDRKDDGGNTAPIVGGQLVDMVAADKENYDEIVKLHNDTVKKNNLASTTGTATDNAMSQDAVTKELNKKVDKADGKGLSTNDYTTSEKQKLAALPDSSQLNQSLNSKVDKEAGKGLSSNDYTTTEKNKLSALPDSTQLNQSLNSKVDKTSVVQTTGQSTASVMSQKAVTNELDRFTTNIDDINDGLTSINQALNAKVNITDIVNNLTTGGTAKPLSAEQGKILKSEFDKHSGNQTVNHHVKYVSSEDLDTITDAGFYEVQAMGTGKSWSYDFLLVGRYENATSISPYIYQLYINEDFSRQRLRKYNNSSKTWTEWEDVTSVKRSDITNDATLLADETQNGLLKKEHYKIIEDMEKNFDNLVGEVKRIADAQGSYIGSNYADKISIQHINETSLALDYATIAANGDYKIVTKNDSFSGAVTNSTIVPIVLSPNDYVRIYANKMSRFHFSAGSYAESIIVQSPTLFVLNINNRGIKNVSVSSCPELNELYLYINNIESVNISNNPKLSIFLIYNNKLKTLDISKNTALQNLQIGGNTDLNTLTLPTGNFSVMSSFLADRTALTLDTIMQLADKLPDRTATATGVFRISKTVYESMAAEQRAVITNKNFNLIAA